MAKKASVGKGLIQGGGDRWNYLGHMRSPKNAKSGHNQGDPSGAALTPTPTAPPVSTPLTPPAAGGGAAPSMPARGRGSAQWGATHQLGAARMGVRQARRTGGDVAGAKATLQGVKAQKKQTFQGLGAAEKGLRQAEAKPGGGRIKAAKETLKGARQTAKSSFKGAYKARQAAKQKKSNGDSAGDNAARAAKDYSTFGISELF